VDIFTFITTVVVVTASGALAPGPLFFTNITQGAKSGARSGLIFSVGHMIVEFSLVMALAFGLLTIAHEPIIKLIIGVAGGTALLVFGVLQIRDSLASKFGVEQSKGGLSSKNPLLLGLLFTGLNPYFILWWLFAGLPLIQEALAFASLGGVVLMYVAHIWMDYAWLTATAHLAKKGINLIGTKGYRILMLVFGLALVFFGLYFLASPFLVKPS